MRRALLLLAVAVICAAGALSGTANAAIKIKEANVALSDKGKRAPPTVVVKFYQNINDWDASGQAVVFHTYVYLKANVGTYFQNYSIHIPGPNTPDARITDVPKSGKLVRIWRDTGSGSFPSSKLGINTTRAIQLCRQALPNGVGNRFIDYSMQVTLHMTVLRRSTFKGFSFTRAIPAKVSCVGLPANQGKADPKGPTRQVAFHVTGASLKVSKFGRRCPRLITVRVTLKGNKDGRARYTLRRSGGKRQQRVMLVKWQGGRRYRGSFDHQFKVRRSKTVRVWIVRDGRRITPKRRIRINCKRSYKPKGVYVE